MASTYRAVMLTKAGGPEVLQRVELPVEEPVQACCAFACGRPEWRNRSAHVGWKIFLRAENAIRTRV